MLSNPSGHGLNMTSPEKLQLVPQWKLGLLYCFSLWNAVPFYYNLYHNLKLYIIFVLYLLMSLTHEDRKLLFCCPVFAQLLAWCLMHERCLVYLQSKWSMVSQKPMDSSVSRRRLFQISWKSSRIIIFHIYWALMKEAVKSVCCIYCWGSMEWAVNGMNTAPHGASSLSEGEIITVVYILQGLTVCFKCTISFKPNKKSKGR